MVCLSKRKLDRQSSNTLANKLDTIIICTTDQRCAGLSPPISMSGDHAQTHAPDVIVSAPVVDSMEQIATAANDGEDGELLLYHETLSIGRIARSQMSLCLDDVARCSSNLATAFVAIAFLVHTSLLEPTMVYKMITTWRKDF